MKLVVLGSGGYHPNEQRHTACYFLPEVGVVLDCGTGAFRLEKFLPRDRLTILLSHGHLDHVAGLTYLLGFQARGLLGAVDVYGLPEVVVGVREHLFSVVLFPVLPQIDWRPVGFGEVLTISGGVSVRVLEAEHRGATANFRLDCFGRSLAYLTDTTAAGSLAHRPVLENVDILLHECYFPDGFEEMAQQTGHTCLGQAIQVAQELKARRLVLIHINPLVDSPEKLGFKPSASYEPPTILAEDWAEIQF
ncbi:MAG: MBL fold metallo-hydrolase [Thermoguttaceae bacterium]|nr:MBL fold metallo-hydrolase [Thermoguttaceae bacterium]MDW8077815.1 MBL fold metallo-hydrolase [Thermoguttaceae bacterium]